MDSQMQIMEAFRNLVIQFPYNDLSVAQIVAASGVSKKTFYKYFESKQDILRRVLEEDTVLSAQRFMKSLYQEQLLATTQLSMEMQFTTIKRHSDFYIALYAGQSRSSVRKLLTKIQYDFEKELFQSETAHMQPVDLQELDFSCWFFASALSNAIEWWIDNNFNPDAHGMAVMYDNWVFAHNREVGRFNSAVAYSREGQA